VVSRPLRSTAGRGAALGAAVFVGLVLGLALGLVTGVAGVGGALRTGHAADRSFTLQDLETTADIRSDGSMAVTEVVTYDFDGGPFNFGVRSFERDLASIHDFAAADAEGPLAVIDPADSESGQWEWHLRRPTADEVATYTVTYVVDGAVEVGNDVGELNWQFMGTEHPAIGHMAVVVRLPSDVPAAQPNTPDADTSVLRAFAHGPTNGTLDVSSTGVVADVDHVPAGQFVELHVVVPLSAFTTIGARPLLADILEQEGTLRREDSSTGTDRRSGPEHHDLAYLLAPLLSGIALLGTGATWLLAGREAESTEVLGEYWREPLDDPPAVALTNLHRGTVPVGEAFAGTLVDLAQRGYLRINGVREERWGPDRTVHVYQWLGKAPGPDVRAYEQQVLDFVFRGQPTASSEELRDWARHHQRQAKGELDAIGGAVKAEYARRGYEARVDRTAVVALTVMCAAIGIASWALRAYTHNGLMWVGVAVAVGSLVGGYRLLMNRTQAGVEAAAKAVGLKRFLHDFSRLEDAPIGHLILWERYLVYAVALGVSAELLDGLGARLPALVADPRFSTWYVAPAGGHGHFDGFDHMASFGDTIVSASTPRSSGSSGGFSGGSSGGGGGGGFGAH